ncbi:GntR family transcriptional regulator [Paenibacillus phyllosphaerae]|uniref:GntR family transcriptional regulator n=1 Tax=Paenibacillus phyllosphaerae TaxID=274593 RepID=A0A7W5AYS1_9BACL|nr:GntR family transcriptional regulator [Paenibacillus phyllosphaerae]MBB3111077.1 GntR family transcriptional regulator [Paenibacillus phyllosphaerae]
MQLDFNSPKPIYSQMVDEVKKALARGELSPGDKIPSHKEQAQISKVNPNTVQRAYQEMEREGLTETLRGQGTFIRKDPALLVHIRSEMAQAAVRQFIEEMQGLGIEPEETERMLRRHLYQEEEG